MDCSKWHLNTTNYERLTNPLCHPQPHVTACEMGGILSKCLFIAQVFEQSHKFCAQFDLNVNSKQKSPSIWIERSMQKEAEANNTVVPTSPLQCCNTVNIHLV